MYQAEVQADMGAADIARLALRQRRLDSREGESLGLQNSLKIGRGTIGVRGKTDIGERRRPVPSLAAAAAIERSVSLQSRSLLAVILHLRSSELAPG